MVVQRMQTHEFNFESYLPRIVGILMVPEEKDHSSQITSFPRLRHGEGNGNPLQYSCLENPMEGGAW